MAPRPFPNSLKYNHLTDYSGTQHFLFSAVGADVKMTKMNRDKDLDIQLPFGVICFSYDGPEVKGSKVRIRLGQYRTFFW